MIAPKRLIHSLVLVLLAFVARALHAEFRAPGEVAASIGWHLVLGLLFAVSAAVVAAPPITRHVTTAVLSAVAAATVGLGASATLLVIVPVSVPRFSVIVMTAMAFTYLAVAGSALAIHARRSGRPLRVVVVAVEDDAAALTAEEPPRRSAGFRVVAQVVDENARHEIGSIVRRTEADVVVLGRWAALDAEVLDQIAGLHEEGVRVRSLESFYDEQLGKLPLSSLDRFAMMGDIQSLHGAYEPVKRALDIVTASIGFLLLVLLLPFVLVGNLIGNRGPLLFRQERVGLLGDPFEILKFRTMQPGAVDISGWTSNDDPRITPFGKVLRRTHVDELPQMINILRGELSMIGPRPEQVVYVEQLVDQLPFYGARHLVRPGLTGWAQVMYPYAASEEDAFVKLQYDLHYLRHESLVTDLRIIGMTIGHLFREGGR